MSIVPDVKDWTWVLERACPECGFDAAHVGHEALPELLRESAARFAQVLQRPDCRIRPNASTWSVLEYGAHMRDICRLYHTRSAVMLAGDPDGGIPRIVNWDQDAAAIADRYADQDPARVAVELVEAAERAARSFETVPPAQRGLSGVRTDGAVFTVESFTRYVVHDLVHHVYDVRG
ncbi:DinB family protein [Nocardia sp. CNY236]|uniref:DinB family protein n=1 Tax=Nocardia sp. CNY236 TaxID=1169152 RepID=UPI0004167202|nr:DinB family protein [Nocardia sp. CNY236]